MLTLKRYAQYAYNRCVNEVGYANYPDGTLGFCWTTPRFVAFGDGMPDALPYRRIRIPGEYRHTGRAGSMGCHDCTNHQLKAEYLVSDFDYRGIPGLSSFEAFDLIKFYRLAYPKHPIARPVNGRYYVGSEQKLRSRYIDFFNVAGGFATPDGARGGYGPVFSGVAPAGYASFAYQDYGVTAVSCRSTTPFYASGRMCYLTQTFSAQVDDRGNLRGSVKRSISVTTRQSSGEYSYNGSSWVLGGQIPYAWIPVPSLAGFWSIVANPLSDYYGIIGRVVGTGGLEPTGINPFVLDSAVRQSSIEDLLRFLGSKLPYSGSLKPVPEEYDWSDLCDTAVDNCHVVSLNGIAFLGDFLRLGRSIIALIHGDLSKIPTAAEDLWLTMRYGLTQTFRDFREVSEAVVRTWPEAGARPHSLRVRARAHYPYQSLGPWLRSGTQVRNVEVFYSNEDNRILSTIRALMDWDVWPTLQNDWDLIPFSFVVDWVARLEACCNHIDRRIYEEYIQIDNVLYTTRDTQVYEPSTMNFGQFRCLSCEYVSYVRHQAPFLVFAPLRVQRGHSSAVNAVDAGALLIQVAR